MAGRASRAADRRPAGIRPAAPATPQRPGALTAARAFRASQQAAAREFRLQQTAGGQAAELQAFGGQAAGMQAFGRQVAGEPAFGERTARLRPIGRQVVTQQAIRWYRIQRQAAQRRAAQRQMTRPQAARPLAVRPPAGPQQAARQRIGRERAARPAAEARRAAERRIALAAEARQAAERRIVQAQARRMAQAAAAASRTVRLRAIRQHSRPVVPHRRTVVTKHAAVRNAQRVMRLPSGMTAVIAYARSQVGKRYVSGGDGPYGFDCSGFTKRAYAQAGIRLPHSSGAQAALARSVSRAQARPGDLVVGPGHVGIYMGRGMMIDAGNRRTGVVYRRLYSGLRVARL